ncbi:hypothetical protein HBI73_197030 [Parastagonospora nodorum]|nr:hypothetical protein HBI73_197030 [Parastagonospora nodorum]
MHASLRKELEARHSLLNLSVYDLVEEFARYSVYAVFKYLASSSNLFTTIRCRASSLIYIKQKHLKVYEADALKQVDANIKEEENKNYSSLYYSNSNSNTATRKIRIKAYSLLDSNNYCLNSSLDINSKDDLEDKEATTKNEVVVIDSINSILCDLSNLLVIRFCIFSNPALENIGILTNKEIVEMQTNTATALANKLTAINKLIIAEANMPAVHSKFALVCSFRKVDRHVFKANNTISVIRRTVFNKFYNCKLESTIIAKFYKDL